MPKKKTAYLVCEIFSIQDKRFGIDVTP